MFSFFQTACFRWIEETHHSWDDRTKSLRACATKWTKWTNCSRCAPVQGVWSSLVMASRMDHIQSFHSLIAWCETLLSLRFDRTFIFACRECKKNDNSRGLNGLGRRPFHPVPSTLLFFIGTKSLVNKEVSVHSSSTKSKLFNSIACRKEVWMDRVWKIIVNFA